MKASELFRQLESDARLLQKISQNYSPSSPEHTALRRAALSLTYVIMNQHADFQKFVDEATAALTDDQRRELRERYGIEESSFPRDTPMTFGNRLRQVRESANMTRRQLATATASSATTR